MGDNVLKLTTELSTKGVEKGFEAIKKGTLSTAKAVNKALDGIKSIVKKVISLGALKKIFDQFKQYLDSSLRKNREYATSMKALKGSIAAAFQPIYEIAAPAIIRLVQLLNMVVQAIGRFIAALSGKSYSQMLKNAQALSKQKDLLNGVGGAAKDAARQLMSFDEINRLEDNSGSGSDMTFSEVDLGSATGAIDDFAKKLRELFQNGQFEQAGELIANSVNKMLNAFDAEKLGAKVGTWVQNFADFMNGLLFGIEWDKIGEDLAKGINGLLSKVKGSTIGEILRLKFTVAIGMFAGFIKNFDGSQAGSFLGDALLGFAQGLGADIEKNFDAEFWEKLNQNIEDGFAAFVPRFISALKVAVDAVIKQAPEVVGTLGNIGLQVVDAITEALSAMDEEVLIATDKYDEKGFQLNRTGSRWEALGVSVAEGFKKIDWAGILTGSIDSVGKLAKGIVEFISSAIAGINDQWKDIGAAIAEGFNKIPWSEILEKGLASLGDLAIGLCEMLISALQKINWTEIGAAIVDGIKSIRWVDLASAILGAALALINSFIELLLGMVDSALGTNLSDKFAEWSGKKQKEYIEKTIEQQKAEAEKAKELVGQWLDDPNSDTFRENFTNHSVDVQEDGVLSVDRNAYIRSAFEDYHLSYEKVSELARAIAVSQDVVDEYAAAFGVTAENARDTADAVAQLNEEASNASSAGSKVTDHWDDVAHTFENVTKNVDEYIAHFSEYLNGERSRGDVYKEALWLNQNGVNGNDLLNGLNRALDQSDSQYAVVLEALQPFIDMLNKLSEMAGGTTDSIDEMAAQTKSSTTDAKSSMSSYSAEVIESADAVSGSVDGVAESTEGMASRTETSLSAAAGNFTSFRNNTITDLSAVGASMDALAVKASALSSLQLGKIGTSMKYGSSPSWSVDFSNLYYAAEGAVIPPNREFMAVFGDQRTGTNIEAPESLIRQIVREEAGSSGNSGRLESLLEELIGTVGNIRIGDDTIGRAATRYSRAHGRAVGV